MSLLEKIRSKRSEIEEIAKKYGATHVRVFGSLAKGEATLESDIDFLIQLEMGRTLFDIIALKQDLEDLLGRQVDVVTERSLSPYLRDEIMKNAVNI